MVNLNFNLTPCASNLSYFLSVWIRIRIRNMDADLHTKRILTIICVYLTYAHEAEFSHLVDLLGRILPALVNFSRDWPQLVLSKLSDTENCLSRKLQTFTPNELCYFVHVAFHGLSWSNLFPVTLCLYFTLSGNIK